MVTVKFFAVLRKLTGREDISLPVRQPVTLKEIFDQIETEIPQIRTIMKEGRALVAINQEMATEDSLVQDGDEIAMLPPFAGGANSF
jgi:molybdopterin converting factor small subunit